MACLPIRTYFYLKYKNISIVSNQPWIYLHNTIMTRNTLRHLVCKFQCGSNKISINIRWHCKIYWWQYSVKKIQEDGWHLNIFLNLHKQLLHVAYHLVLGLWCLSPLSTIFQLYHGGQFYWWWKPEYPEEIINYLNELP